MHFNNGINFYELILISLNIRSLFTNLLDVKEIIYKNFFITK